MDYRACSEASTNITSNKPKNYRKWSEKERYEIGKCAAIHGSRAAERKFHNKEKPLSEGNARRFPKLYKEEISKTQKSNRDVNRNLSINHVEDRYSWAVWIRWCRDFLFLRRTGRGFVSSTVAISAAKALITRNPQYNLSHIDLDSSH